MAGMDISLPYNIYLGTWTASADWANGQEVDFYGGIAPSFGDISFDLGYKKSDRIKQNKRVLGLAKIVIKNGYYPIISGVYLDPKIFREAKKAKIRVINVLRSKKFTNQKLGNKKNIVGKSIKQPKLKCEIFYNTGKKFLMSNKIK